MVQIAPQHTALRRDGARVWIDADAFHEGQVDDESAVVRSVSGRAVAAAADGNEEPEQPREVDGLLDVRSTQAPHDERRATIDVAVPYAPRLFVLRLAGDDELAAQASSQALDVGVVQVGARPFERGGGDRHVSSSGRGPLRIWRPFGSCTSGHPSAGVVPCDPDPSNHGLSVRSPGASEGAASSLREICPTKVGIRYGSPSASCRVCRG